MVQFSYDAIIAPVKQLVNPTGSDFCKSGIQALVHYWQKCIANSVDYVEKCWFVAENFSIRYCYCALCRFCNFYGNKSEALHLCFLERKTSVVVFMVKQGITFKTKKFLLVFFCHK